MESIKGIRILLVDDEPNVLQFLEIGLQNEGFAVQSAPDGMMAITLMRKFRPHVVILDVMMPGMDGFEVCRLIKKTDKMIIRLAQEAIDSARTGMV